MGRGTSITAVKVRSPQGFSFSAFLVSLTSLPLAVARALRPLPAAVHPFAPRPCVVRTVHETCRATEPNHISGASKVGAVGPRRPALRAAIHLPYCIHAAPVCVEKGGSNSSASDATERVPPKAAAGRDHAFARSTSLGVCLMPPRCLRRGLQSAVPRFTALGAPTAPAGASRRGNPAARAARRARGRARRR